MQVWVYHKTEAPKIIHQDDVEEYLSHGWAESPAAFTDLSKVMDMTNETEIQIVGGVMEEMVDMANDGLAVKSLKRKGLVKLAEKYGIDSDEVSTPNLRKRVIEAIHGDGN